MAQATPDAEQLVTAYVTMWNDRDYAQIPELVSESFVISTKMHQRMASLA